MTPIIIERPEHAKKILILGYYGFGNIGDDAILRGLIEGIRFQAPKFDIEYLSPMNLDLNQGKKYECINWHPSLIWALKHPMLKLKSINRIIKADLLIIGGGGLFHDIYSIIPFAFFDLILRYFFGRPIVMVSIGVGPFNSKISPYFFRRVFKIPYYISVRDKTSYLELQQLNQRNDVEISCDLALILSSQFEARVVSNNNKQEYSVIISLRRWGNFEVNIPRIAHKIESSMQRIGPYKLVFIPFDSDDIEMYDLFNQSLKNKSNVEIVLKPLNSQDVMKQFVKADLVIGMRLHSIILSAMVGIPSISISYEQKVRDFSQNLPKTLNVCCELEKIADCDFYDSIQYLLLNNNTTPPPFIKNCHKKNMDSIKKALSIVEKGEL